MLTKQLLQRGRAPLKQARPVLRFSRRLASFLTVVVDEALMLG